MNTLFMHSVQSRSVEFGKWIATGIYTIGMCLLLILLLILSLFEMLGRYLVGPFSRQMAVIFKILFPPSISFKRSRESTDTERAKECRFCGVLSLVSFIVTVAGILLMYNPFSIAAALAGLCLAVIAGILYITTIYWSCWLATDAV